MICKFADSKLDGIRFVRAAMLSVCLAFVMLGCSRSPRVTFYTLEPTAPVEHSVAATVIPTVAVGPITLPELVDRPQFVVRVAANRVEILESHRWAEPLKSEIPRLIAENLRKLLGSGNVMSYLQHAGVKADYRVLVDFRRFESSPGEAVTVEAAWSLRRGTNGDVPKTGSSLVREPVSAAGYDPLVAAYSRALLAVSRDLAAAIRTEITTGQ